MGKGGGEQRGHTENWVGEAPARLPQQLYVPGSLVRDRRGGQADSTYTIPAHPARTPRRARPHRPAFPRSAAHHSDRARRPRRIGRGNPSSTRTSNPSDGGALHQKGQPEAPCGGGRAAPREGVEQMMNLGKLLKGVGKNARYAGDGS